MRLRKRGLVVIFLGGLCAGYALNEVRHADPLTEAWARGFYAALDTVADENSYANNAADRVKRRLWECLGSGRQWSDPGRDCAAQ